MGNNVTMPANVPSRCTALIGTARLNGLDPEAYLAYVLDRIADHPANCIDELLSWRVAPSLPSTGRVEPIR